MRRPSPLTVLAAVVLCAVVLASGVSQAMSRTIGTLPPRHPAADCSGYGTSAIDSCRRAEGIGPLTLPSNWHRLSPTKQLFVLINLERVNRGLAPITLLLTPLDTLARSGAEAGTDPRFPTEGGANGEFRGGGIYATDDPPSLLEADVLWMYQDAGSHWGHRDNILMPGTNLVGGAGATSDTWDFEMLSGYRYAASTVAFRWSSELRYFAKRPGPEPL